MKKYFVSSVYARLITSAMLFISLYRLPIGYYNFLRWVTCGTALYVAFISYLKKDKINFGVWLFVLIALLFNPILPFYLGRELWQIVDVIVAMIFMLSIIFIRETNDETF